MGLSIVRRRVRSSSIDLRPICASTKSDLRPPTGMAVSRVAAFFLLAWREGPSDAEDVREDP